jgi:multiple sugar transport system ATP-binding protein
MNFLSGELESGPPPALRAGDLRIPLDRYTFGERGAAGGHCVLGVRPESVAVGADGAARPFSREVEIEIVEPMGAATLVWTKLAGGNFSFLVDSESRVKVGERTLIGFDPGRASLFDEATGDRL